MYNARERNVYAYIYNYSTSAAPLAREEFRAPKREARDRRAGAYITFLGSRRVFFFSAGSALRRAGERERERERETEREREPIFGMLEW